MDTLSKNNNNNNNIKDNWDDSSESEQEEETNVLATEPINKGTTEEVLYGKDNNQEDKFDENDQEWDFYDGQSVCINCSKACEVRIIMIKSKRIFCYDACLENNNNEYDDDYGDDDYGDDDYDELDDYDRKLGLSISCR